MIRHFKTKAFLAFLGLYFVFSANVLNAFSAQDIISPVNGTWNNVQPLVLNAWDGSELYYSFSGSDPLNSGFSYDGPVIIDATGTVNLRITAVSPQGKRSDYKISYSVIPSADYSLNENEAVFISNLVQSPIVSIPSGSFFNIPDDYYYCTSNDADYFFKGQTISVAESNVLERYVPCIIKKNQNIYHVVLHTIPSSQVGQTIEPKNLPFEISNWTDFKFTGKKLIYKIDDSLWSADTNIIKLDRSVSHTIYWQSMAFELGNPIEQYTIPSQPQIVVAEGEVGECKFYVDSDDPLFRIGIDTNTESGNAFVLNDSSIVFDTFYGDEISDDINFVVYYDGLLQGTINSSLNIDHRPPRTPGIISSSETSSSRDKVSIKITGEKDDNVYYSLSNAVDTSLYSSMDQVLEACVMNDFELYDGKAFVLGSISDAATFYKLLAYSKDSKGNKSSEVEYSVVIDEYNIYVDSSYIPVNGKEGDGSLLNPFSSFATAVKYANSKQNTTIHVISPVILNNQSVKITSDCSVVGKDTSITLSGNSVFGIENANVKIKDCFFTRNDSTKKSSSANKLFNIKNADVTFENCEVLGVFKGNCSLVNSNSSVLSVLNSGFTLQTSSYGSVFNLEKTDFKSTSSRFTCSGETSVCFSAHDGKYYMESSSCVVQGSVGRCIELSSVDEIHVISSSLTSRNSVSSCSSGLFWADKNSVVVEYEDIDENVL